MTTDWRIDQSVEINELNLYLIREREDDCLIELGRVFLILIADG